MDINGFVKLAEKLGADEAEIFIEAQRTRRIAWKGKERKAVGFETLGMGIRVNVKGKEGFVSLSEISKDSIMSAIKTCIKIAKLSKFSEHYFAIPEKYSSSNTKVFDKHVSSLELDEMDEKAKDLFQSEKLVFPRGYLQANANEVMLFSAYSDISEIRTQLSSTFTVRYEDAVFKKFASSRSLENFEKLVHEKIAHSEEIVRLLLHPKMLSTRTANILLLPDASAKIFARFVEECFCCSQKQREERWEIGSELCKENISIIDDGTLPYAPGSRGFDDEGIPTQKTKIIEKGKLCSYLYDYSTAKLLGRKATGNSNRNYASLPTTKPCNIIVEEGSMKLEEIPDNTFIVEKIIGAKLSNFVRGVLGFTVAFGYYLNQNTITAVSNMVVHDDFFDCLKNRVQPCKGAEWYGNVCTPAIFIENVKVCGK